MYMLVNRTILVLYIEYLSSDNTVICVALI